MGGIVPERMLVRKVYTGSVRQIPFLFTEFFKVMVFDFGNEEFSQAVGLPGNFAARRIQPFFVKCR